MKQAVATVKRRWRLALGEGEEWPSKQRRRRGIGISNRHDVAAAAHGGRGSSPLNHIERHQAWRSSGVIEKKQRAKIATKGSAAAMKAAAGGET